MRRVAQIKQDARARFWYLPVPDHVREQLAEIGRDLAEQAGGVPDDADHVTLAFVPKADDALDDDEVADALDAVEDAIADFAAFQVWVGGIAYFDTAVKDKQPATALVALIDGPGLDLLHHAVADALRDRGWDWEDTHSFTAHCTLAYLPVGARADDLPVIDRSWASWTVGGVNFANAEVHHVPFGDQPASARGTQLPMLSEGPVVAAMMCGRRPKQADLHGEALRGFRTQPNTGAGELYPYCRECVNLEQIPAKQGDPAAPGQVAVYGCVKGDDDDVVQYSQALERGEVQEQPGGKGCPGFVERGSSTDVDSTNTVREARRVQAGGVDDWDDAPNLDYGGREAYEDEQRHNYKALVEQAKNALSPLRSADRSELSEQIESGFPQFAIDWLNSHEEYAIADQLHSLFAEFLDPIDYRDFDLRGRKWRGGARRVADLVKSVPGTTEDPNEDQDEEPSFFDDPLVEDPQVEPVAEARPEDEGIEPAEQPAPDVEVEIKIDPTRYIWRHSVYPPGHHQRFSHQLRDGRVFEWDDPPFDGHPGTQDGCFLGDALISSPATVLKAYRRWYDGPLTALVTSSGESLRATPNHPVLTRRGWIPIHLVDVGDDLFQVPQQGLLDGEQQPERAVTRFDQMFRSALLVGSSHRIPGRFSGFHGDGSDEDVDVVTIDWELLFDGVSALPQRFCQLLLALADRTTTTESALPQLLIGMGHASHSIMRSCGKLLTLLGGGVGHTVERARAAVTWLDSISDQILADGCAVDLEVLRQLLHAPAGEEHRNRLVARVVLGIGGRAVMETVSLHSSVTQSTAQVLTTDAQNPRDLNERHGLQHLCCLNEKRLGELVAGLDPTCAEMSAESSRIDPQTTADLGERALLHQSRRVVQKIVGESFSGHVYNLETLTGWYTVSNLIVHNCKCWAEGVLLAKRCPICGRGPVASDDDAILADLFR